MVNQDYKEALKQHQLGNLEPAKLIYEKILGYNPHDVEVLHLSGILAAQQQDFVGAFDFILRALEIDPNSPILHNSLGNVLKNLGKLDEALNHYQKALRLQPNDAVFYNNIANIYCKLDRLNEAINYYQKALHFKPNYVDANYNLGLMYFRQNNLEQAKKYFLRTLSFQPQHAEAHYNLAKLLQRQQNNGLAIAHYQKSLRIDFSNLFAHNNLAGLLVTRGKHSLAIWHFKKILQQDPKNCEALYNLGSIFLKQNNSEAALKYFLCLSLITRDFNVYYNLGVIYMDMSRSDDAIEYFTKALGIKANDFATHINLGSIYLRKPDYEKAIQHYQIVKELQPNNAEVNYIIAALLQNSKPTAAPREYVQHLFDQYAQTFDKHLEFLQYQAPQLLYDAVTKITGFCRAKFNVMDLGCGTGLCGEKFRNLAKKMIGIDLSEKMLDIARQKNIYDELKVAAIEEALNDYHDIDLILAADTFVYIGNLSNIFNLCAKLLNFSGLLAFTVENTEDYPYLLQNSMRFAHNHRYIKELAQKNAFTILYNEKVTIRKQHNVPVISYLYILRKS